MMFCKYANFIGIGKHKSHKQNKCHYYLDYLKAGNITSDSIVMATPRCPADALKNDYGHNCCYITEKEREAE